jgi:hypothetical protein
MPRTYHVGAVALALDVDSRWIDSAIAADPSIGTVGAGHDDPKATLLPGRGNSRSFTVADAVRLALIRRLAAGLGLPLSRAALLATRLQLEPEVEAAPGLRLGVDIGTLVREVTDRLAEAAEVVVPVRRGRPPRVERGAR